MGWSGEGLVGRAAGVGVEVGTGLRCVGAGLVEAVGRGRGGRRCGGGARWDHDLAVGGGCELRPELLEIPGLRKPQVQRAEPGSPAGAGGGAPSGCRSGSGAPGEERAEGEWSLAKGVQPSPLSRGAWGGPRSFELSEDSGGFEGCCWAGGAGQACLCLS